MTALLTALALFLAAPTLADDGLSAAHAIRYLDREDDELPVQCRARTQLWSWWMGAEAWSTGRTGLELEEHGLWGWETRGRVDVPLTWGCVVIECRTFDTWPVAWFLGWAYEAETAYSPWSRQRVVAPCLAETPPQVHAPEPGLLGLLAGIAALWGLRKR